MYRFLLVLAISLNLAIQPFAIGSKDSVKETSQAEVATDKAMVLKTAAIKGPTGLGMIYLFENPPLLAQNASVKTEALASADAMAAKMLSREVDIALLPVNMAAKLYNSGLDYRLLAVVGNGMFKILSADTSIKAVGDLKGKELYIAGQGATPDFLLQSILPAYGIKPEQDIKLVYNMAAPEIAASLIAGRVRHAVLPEPFATMAMLGNPEIRVALDLSKLWAAYSGQNDYPVSVVVIKSSIIADRPKAVSGFMDAYKASIDAVLANPIEAGQLAEKHELGLKADIAAKAIPECAFTFIKAPEAKASIEALLSIFLKAAPVSVGGKLPDEGFYVQLQN